MIHIFAIWDRTSESEYLRDLFKSVGFIQTTSVPADIFLEHPVVPDDCDVVFLIGTCVDRSFYAAADVIREHCPNLPFIISTTAGGMETEGISTFSQDLSADIWIVCKPGDDASGRFGQQILRILKKIPGKI